MSSYPTVQFRGLDWAADALAEKRARICSLQLPLDADDDWLQPREGRPANRVILFCLFPCLPNLTRLNIDGRFTCTLLAVQVCSASSTVNS